MIPEMPAKIKKTVDESLGTLREAAEKGMRAAGNVMLPSDQEEHIFEIPKNVDINTVAVRKTGRTLAVVETNDYGRTIKTLYEVEINDRVQRDLIGATLSGRVLTLHLPLPTDLEDFELDIPIDRDEVV